MCVCAMVVALVACNDDEPDKRQPGDFRTVASAEELIGAVNEGADIYVPEGKVIDMSGKAPLAVNKEMEVCVDGVVKGLSGYIYVNKDLKLSGKGRIETTGTGGFYVNPYIKFDATDITIDYKAPEFKVVGCPLYVSGGKITLTNVTITSTNQCIFSSQVIRGSQITATSCKFLSTATQYNCCYALEAAGEVWATYTDCEISSFYGGVIAESPRSKVHLKNSRCAVYKPTNPDYVCDYTVSADYQGSITIDDGTAMYGEGKYAAVQNNRVGPPAGTLHILSACTNIKPHDIPSNRDIDPEGGKVWKAIDENFTFYYPDGSTRQCKQLWTTD